MDVWYLYEFVFAEVELIETWQLKEATRDSNQFIVLQIKFHYLKREGRRGREGGREGGREEGDGMEGERRGMGGRDGGREEKEVSHLMSNG